MAIHVAILKRPYAHAILAGTKTVESRLTRVAMPPYRSVEPGERIFIKVSGGPFTATALASRITCFGDLTPGDIGRLRNRYEAPVGGGDGYWHTKRDSRFATFITLTEVEPLDVGPSYPKSMRAWHVLDDVLNPIRDITLTGGAIRNAYVSLSLPPAETGSPVELILPDKTVVATDFSRGSVLRWRGWRAYFREWEAEPGDMVRFVALKPRRYCVSFRKVANPPEP